MKPIHVLIPFLLALNIVSGYCQNSLPKNNKERIAYLNQYGVKAEKQKIILLYPKDSIPAQRISELIDTLNLEISKAQALIGAPLSWQVFAHSPITFYLCPGDFIANTSEEGFVMVPLKRIRANRVPWLHEAMHALLRTKSGNWNSAPQEKAISQMPMWLTEGLPEYIAQKIAFDNHYPKFDVHKGGGYLKVDSICNAVLNTPIASTILPFVGGKGVLVELFGEKRATYAPPFYNCSCSFTKYITETYGLNTSLTAISIFGEEQEELERQTGISVEIMKQQWLQSLNRK